MHKVALLSKEKRGELFAETASKMGTTNAIVEKDFWVVWVLSKVFADERLNSILMFKGGTSLSKVFDLIGRFSEDVDLILDWTLVTKDDPCATRTNNKQDKFNKLVNESAKTYIEDTLLPILTEILSPVCECKIDDNDAFSINIKYPSVFDDTYLRPEILLEIGPLASWLPSKAYKIQPFAAKHFPKLFNVPKCTVNTIVAQRTFWEKATILHHEANRPESSQMPPRYSRHYYDLAMMATSNVKAEALMNFELLENVVEFKKKFYSRSWAEYDSAKPGTLKLLPPTYRLNTLKKDYAAMSHMIFDKHLEFDEIIAILSDLEAEINRLK
ncbi:MAG TPA: nucleotidyl transferase AbiEii/AbiGii toxin family protein [Sulfurospirillum arcachonense]|nr:nucleotidyl transferase AbiEii/AbiGii toxin family protein [Sulfurospirillum arcachonense]